MAYAPVQLLSTPMEDYAGYWLKFYEQGTVTPLAMATDAAAGTTLAKAEVSSGGDVPIGFLQTAAPALLNPFVSGDYDAWLFPTAAEANADDTDNAIQVADNLNSDPLNITNNFTFTGSIQSGYVATDKAEAVALSLTSTDDGRKVFVTSTDGGPFTIRYNSTPSTYADDGGVYTGTVFIPSGGDGTIGFTRDYVGAVYDVWFGVQGDGTDDTVAVQAMFTSHENLFFDEPSTVISITSTVTLRDIGYVVNGVAGIQFKTVFEYSGSGYCFSDTTDSQKRHIWDRISINNNATNVNSNVGALFLTGTINSYFNISTLAFDIEGGVTIDAGSVGSFWNKFDDCRLWPEDIAGAASVLLTSSGGGACNAYDFISCDMHETSNVASGALANGVVADHITDSIGFIGGWYERLNYAAVGIGTNWKFIGSRFEKIYDDAGAIVQVDTTLGATAGKRLKIDNCSNSAGSIRVHDESNANYDPDFALGPPYSLQNSFVTNYTRANADGKDGFIESSASPGTDLQVTYTDELWQHASSPTALQLQATIAKFTVAGGSDGDVSVSIQGVTSGGAAVVIGVDSESNNITAHTFFMPVGTTHFNVITPPMNSAQFGATLDHFVVRINEPPAGVTVTLAGMATLSVVSSFTGNAVAR